MEDLNKTKEQLLNELAELRREAGELKAREKDLLEDQKRYNFLLDNTKEMILIIDKKGTVLLVNKEALRSFGYLEEEVVGKSIANFITKENIREAFLAVTQEFLRRPRPALKVNVKQKSGEIRTIEVAAGSSPIYDEKGNITAIMINARDIAEEEKALTALKSSEKEYKTIFENLPFMVFMVDRKGGLLEANKRAEEVTGLKFIDFAGKGFADFGILDTKSLVKAFIEFRKNLRGKITDRSVYVIKTKNEQKKVIALVGIPLTEGGKVSRVLIAGQDITEIKKAEEDLKDSEERLKIMFESAPDAYYLNDIKGTFIDGNKAAEKVTGYKRDELIGKSFLKLKLLPPDQMVKAAALLAKNVAGMSTGPDIFTIVQKGGNRVDVEISTHPVKIKGKTLVLGIARDIAGRKEAKDALRASEARFRELFNHMKSGVAVYDAENDGEDFIFRDFNSSAEKIENIKRSDVIGKSVLTIFPGVKNMGLFDVFKRVWKTGQPEHFSPTLYKDERIIGWRENYVYKLFSGEIVAIYDDITESKKAEEEIKKHVKELEVFYKASIGREERILELKDEIKKLKETLGKKE